MKYINLNLAWHREHVSGRFHVTFVFSRCPEPPDVNEGLEGSIHDAVCHASTPCMVVYRRCCWIHITTHSIQFPSACPEPVQCTSARVYGVRLRLPYRSTSASEHPVDCWLRWSRPPQCLSRALFPRPQPERVPDTDFALNTVDLLSGRYFPETSKPELDRSILPDKHHVIDHFGRVTG